MWIDVHDFEKLPPLATAVGCTTLQHPSKLFSNLPSLSDGFKSNNDPGTSTSIPGALHSQDDSNIRFSAFFGQRSPFSPHSKIQNIQHPFKEKLDLRSEICNIHQFFTRRRLMAIGSHWYHRFDPWALRPRGSEPACKPRLSSKSSSTSSTASPAFSDMKFLKPQKVWR